MTIYRETQYRVVDKEMLNYPVLSIEAQEGHSFCITCRDSKNVEIFRKVTNGIKAANTSEAPYIEYELIPAPHTSAIFYLEGKDATKALKRFAEAGLFSQKLLGVVTGGSSPRPACALL